jgi:hypothetical protein
MIYDHLSSQTFATKSHTLYVVLSSLREYSSSWYSVRHDEIRTDHVSRAWYLRTT